MYAIYGIIYHQYTLNVSIYTIHGSYGNGFNLQMSSNQGTRSLGRHLKVSSSSANGWFGTSLCRCSSAKRFMRKDTKKEPENILKRHSKDLPWTSENFTMF